MYCRQVNKKLIADKYAVPRIDEIMDGLGRAKFFSVLGFHHIPLDVASRNITSFSTSLGSFRWKISPFWVKRISQHIPKNDEPGIFRRFTLAMFHLYGRHNSHRLLKVLKNVQTQVRS